MKRLVFFAAILAIMAVQTVAIADDFTWPAQYTGYDEHKGQVNADGYRVVLITKDSDDTIVYINCVDNAFSGVTDFFLNSNPEMGKYNVLLGAESGSPKETYFYVGVDSDKSGDLCMNRLQNDEQNQDNQTWNIAYYATVTVSDYRDCNSVKVGYKDGNNNVYGGFALKDGAYPTTYSGPGELYLIFQLNDVPAAYKNSIAAYLSVDEVSSSL